MENYIKIYDECLNRSYHNEKLEPIINYLYDIVNYYDKDIKENSMDGSIVDFTNFYNNTKRFTMEDLLSVFNVIIEKNNYHDLGEVIAFAFELDFDWTEITVFLNVIYNLECFDKENSIDCDMLMLDVSTKVHTKELNDNYSFSFYQMISCYKKYDLMINNSNIKTEIIRFFNRYSITILYYFYLMNYDARELEEMYDDIINDFEYYISIFEMNYIDMYCPFVFIQDEEKRIIKTIVEDRFNKKSSIK